MSRRARSRVVESSFFPADVGVSSTSNDEGAPLLVGVVPPPPVIAGEVFGDRLPLAIAYAELLCTVGAQRGVIGPREGERIWDRHLLNCAALSPFIPADSAVVDVGSGGGLPGIVLAVARPDLRLTLVDSMARRTDFLTEVVDALGLTARVTVIRARAEELKRRDQVVTARAVADPLRLAQWATKLLGVHGRLVALVGATVVADTDQWRPSMQKSGWADVSVETTHLAGVSPSCVLRARRR